MKRMNDLEISHAPGEGTGPTSRCSFVVGRGDDPAGRDGAQYPISNIQYPIIKGGGNRRGVALIIVLGFLSIMILMAVAFLTQARVERMVAGASLEGMRTRQTAQTAIAAAMQDYLNALKSVSPAETTHDIFLSGDGAGSLSYYFSGEPIGDNRLLVGKVEDWLLTDQLQAALGDGEPADAVEGAEWIWVREQPGARSRILGRYAYACFNMSGLLDANLLGTAYGDNVPDYGDATNRNNVRKMVFEALSQEKGGESQRKLNIHQRIWKGFDTPAALLSLTDGKVNDGDDDNSYNRWTGTDMVEGPAIDVSSLSPYSYSVLHRVDGSGKAKMLCNAANIQGDPDFDKILVGAATREDVIKAMTDYESPMALPPSGVDYASVKNVPMFNEIGIRVGFEKTSDVPADPADPESRAYSTYNLEVHLKAEFWYPFPSQDNVRSDSFKLEPSIGGDRNKDGPASIWVQLQGLSLAEARIELHADGLGDPVQVLAKYNDGKPYYSEGGAEVVFRTALTRMGGDAKLPPDMQLRVGHIQISKDIPLTLKTQTDTQVDSTPNDSTISGIIEFFYNPAVVLNPGDISPGADTDAGQPWEVSDPRLNHRASSWDQTGPSWGGINKAASDAQDKAKDNIGYLPGTNFYCRNGPIERPGELGYFPTWTPWETLDIFSEDGVRLMNRLVCDEDSFNIMQEYNAFFTNGTINPYTRHTNVLNAAFYGVDIREVPNMAGAPEDAERLNGNNLKDLVPEIMKAETKNGYAGWATVLANKNLLADMSKYNRIAVLNNTWGLFNESDRLFVVVVIAQSIKEGEGEAGVGNWDKEEDIITGERRAVALCWLDGSADVGGDTLTQEMNIIMFQYLNE